MKPAHKKIYLTFDEANGAVTMLNRTEKHSHQIKRHIIRYGVFGDKVHYTFTIHHNREF